MAQDVTLRREYDKVIKSAEAVGSLGTDLFGDQTSFYTGTAEFTATDVSLPGTGLIPVSLSRRYVVEDKVGVYGGAGMGKPVYIFGDWQLDIPHLHGVFARSSYGWISGNLDITQRCSVANADVAKPLFAKGPQGGDFAPSEYWHGNSLHVPGAGDQEMLVVVPENTQKPNDGKTYYWVTPGQWYFSCLPATANGVSGEGFLAIDPNGTRYWFDWIVSWQTQQITKPPFAPAVEPVSLHAEPLPPDAIEMAPRAYISAFLRRDKVSIYPTKIQDRFGNTVTYTYDATVKTRLLSIAASDGRTISLGYNGDGRVQSVSDGTRTWNYAYAGGTQLTAVTLPDDSKWQYNLEALAGLYADSSLIDESSCTTLPMNPTQVAKTGSITHPSGAVGTFTFKPTLHGRSYTNLGCIISPDGQGGSFSFSIHPYLFSSLSLQSKKIEGPGLPTGGYAWTYTYGPPNNSEVGCNGCPDTKTVDVQGPDDWTRFTFSNRFQQGEGKLVKTETGTSPNAILRTETSSYRIDPAGQAYPARIGETPFTRSDRTSEKHAPQIQRQIVQQGTTYSWKVNQTNGVYSFDAFARPESVTRSSTPAGYSRTDVADYFNSYSKWVIGLPLSSTNTNTGLIESRTAYDSDLLPWHTYRFENLQETLLYYADGSLKSVADGKGNTTQYADWRRGIPQQVTYADGKVKSAVVSNIGTIASVTDENLYNTYYGYDAMGRLDTIDYPNGDSVDWNNTTLAFEQIASAEYGLPAGHWRQTVRTGNGYKVSYFDALWRPRLVREYDSGDVAGTIRSQLTCYDHEGRPTYASYAKGDVANVSCSLTGTRTAYDAIGRVQTVEQDSELGVLTTTTEYLNNSQGPYTRVKNPRGFYTRTWFQAFDAPSQDAPVAIQHEEGAYTDIVRDVFGKPKSITRRNSTSSVALARQYVYDDYQRLCKTIEPEAASTVLHYDDAGNIDWSAAGLAYTNPAMCNDGSVPASAKVARSYDARNRLETLTFPDGRGDQTWTYTPDGLPSTIVTNNGLGEQVTQTYGYTRRRLLASERLQAGTTDWTVGYAYNSNGHLYSQSLPLGAPTALYSPNALGQPTRVGDYATNVRYHPNGAMAQFSYGNGLIHYLSQNTRGLPDRSQDTYNGNARLDDSYDYDANGNVAAISDALPGNRGDRTMAYDGLDRLTDVTSPMYGTTGAHYWYDVLDNLTRVHIGGTGFRNHYYCYDSASWQLTNVKADSCAGATVTGLGYDARGNVDNQNGTTYDFDLGNRLRGSSAGASVYTYDGHGRRVKDAVNGIAKISLYSQAGQLLIARDERQQVESQYYYLNGSLVAIREKSLPGGAVSTKYQHTDALGTPVAVTDEARTVIERSEYEPYGKLLNRPLEDGPGFTGHVADAATGLDYMQQRYYWTGGRFMSVDPVTATSIGGNFNRYWYANNNPYTFTDPDGRESGAFYTNPQYQMAQPTMTAEMAGTIVDFIPVVGDAKAVYEAYQEPTLVNIAAAGVGFVPIVGDVGGKLLKNADTIADIGKAAANRAENVAKGIPESRLGPSGKPKVHTVDHSTRKGAKEAAARQAPPGGKVRNDAHPQDGQRPHFQAENAKGENVKPVVHHCKPKKAC